MLKPAPAIHVFLAALLLAGGRPAVGAEAPESGAEEESPWVLGLALGHGRQRNPFVDSDDIDLNLVLDIAWFGERFFFDNGDLGFTLGESASFSANAVLTFNNERNYYNYLRNSSGGLGLSALTEGPRLAGEDGVNGEREDQAGAAGATDLGIFPGRVDSSLPKRDFAVSSGLEFLRISRWGDLQAQLLTDVGGSHGGQEAWAAWSYPWFTPAQEFTLSLGLEWKSRELVDYYYGVTPDEVLPGRPEYRGRSAVNPYLRFSASHSLNERWKVVSVLERKFLDDGIQNSPIIDRDTVDTFFIGLYYRF